eukprot:695450-Rhodomonas_salina.2
MTGYISGRSFTHQPHLVKQGLLPQRKGYKCDARNDTDPLCDLVQHHHVAGAERPVEHRDAKLHDARLSAQECDVE